jgi:hypothetical protein
MTEVRKHKRQTASGKTTTVRHHTRNTGDGSRDDAAQARSAWQDRAAPHYSTLPAPEPQAADDSFWDEDSAEPEGEWWAGDEPPIEKRGYTIIDGPVPDWAMEEAARMIEARERGETWVPRPRSEDAS